MKMNKVKAIWTRAVYSTCEYCEDPEDFIDTSSLDNEETARIENPVRVMEYDSIDKAIRDFLSSNVTGEDDGIGIEEKTVTDESTMQTSVVDCRLHVEHPNMKKKGTEFVRLSNDELESLGEDDSLRVYNFHDVLHVEYMDGSSADKDARKIYRNGYERLCVCRVPVERQRILGEMRKEFKE